MLGTVLTGISLSITYECSIAHALCYHPKNNLLSRGAYSHLLNLLPVSQYRMLMIVHSLMPKFPNAFRFQFMKALGKQVVFL